MTPDLSKLREQLNTLQTIVDHLELELVDDPRWAAPSDASYLTEAERKNPDIAANVEAMNETNKLISWFAEDGEGYVGLWHGPSRRAPAASPIVRLATEGQYAIVAMTIADYLAISMPEEDFATTRQALVDAGFEVAFNPDAIWGAIEAVDDRPNEYRNALYDELKRKSGASSPPEDPTMEKGWTEPPSADPAFPDEAPTEPKQRATPTPHTAKTAPKKKAAKPAPKKTAKKPPPKKSAKKPAPKKSAKKLAPKKSAKKPAPKKPVKKKAVAKKPAKKAPKKASKAKRR